MLKACYNCDLGTPEIGIKSYNNNNNPTFRLGMVGRYFLLELAIITSASKIKKYWKYIWNLPYNWNHSILLIIRCVQEKNMFSYLKKKNLYNVQKTQNFLSTKNGKLQLISEKQLDIGKVCCCHVYVKRRRIS